VDPAESHLGYFLAIKGFYPIVFNHSHPREKPCSDGISVLAIEKFTILKGVPQRS
jgi:hypothetical protein